MTQNVRRRANLSTEQAGSVYIYALTEPDGTPRYVGQTVDIARRFAEHKRGSTSAPVRNWVKRLAARGLEPGLEILHRAQDDECPCRCERRYIRALRATVLNSDRKMPPRSPAGIALRKWLDESEMTYAELGARLGVDASLIGRWVHFGGPSAANAKKLQAVTGIDVALWRSSICPAPHPADTPPPRSNPAAAVPSPTGANEPLSNSRANGQPSETTSAAERSHSAHMSHSAETARHTAQEIR